MKIAMCQLRMEADVDVNIRKSIDAFRKAAEDGADLIMYPEVQLSRFFPQYEGKDASAYLMPIDCSFITEMRALCREYHVMAAPNIYLLENGKAFDATILIGSDGEILGTQKMVHIAQAEQFYEQDYYEPADDGFKVFDTEFGKIGVVVCFDRHYPESMRTEALMGTDLILIPTANTKAEPAEVFDWEIRIQCFQNSVAAAMCNRTGLEDQMDFSGSSILIGADGNVIAKAGEGEEILIADVDLKKSAEIRGSRPYTQLRRTELYI